MMSAIFITGTGTGIGKTFVTAGLLRSLRAAAIPASAIKPVLSGYDTAPGSDPALLLEAMGEPVTDATVATLSPFRFTAPLSPDMAALREGRSIDFAAVLAFCHNAAAARGLTLIEGVGGVMVPLTNRHTTLDLMVALALPIVLVAGSYLGSISHTLTAMAALTQAGLDDITLILNDSGTNEVPLPETVATLARFLPETPLHILPRYPDSGDFAPILAAIQR